MKTSVQQLCRPAAIFLLTALASACAVEGGGYGYGSNVDVGVDYYEPATPYYGGWSPGYRVGPYRGGDHHDFHDDHHPDRGGGGRPPPQHNYHPAPAGHPMPSLPSRPHGGGGPRH